MKIQPKNVLYIEANLDGTVGGSHYCLYEIVKFINRDKYMPSVIFYENNALVTDLNNICDVHIYSQKRALYIERDFPKFYKFIDKKKYLKKLFIFYQRLHNFIGFYIPNVIYIYKFLKKNKIDLVHTNNTPDLSDWLIASKILNVKIVSHLRGPWYPNKLAKMLVGQYDRIISISDWVTDEFIKHEVPYDNVIKIHDGIDLNTVKIEKHLSENIMGEWNIPEGAPVIGIVGNIRKWKGQHVAIEAMRLLVRKYNDIRCIFVGSISNSPYDKEYLHYLKELVSKYDLETNIIFTGFRKDIYEIINNVEIMVHTSILPEPLGRVIFEGMILRKPVIATNHGGPVEIIEDGISGFLVPPENPTELSEKISFLIENKDISKEMGENARKRVDDKFSIEANIKKIEETYSSLYGN